MRRGGFTMMELLLVIGIIGMLSTIALVALNPQQQLDAAHDAHRRVTERELRKVIIEYIIDYDVLPSEIPTGAANAMPICRFGAVDTSDCVNLNLLVNDDYLSALPIDISETDPDWTGYAVYIDGPQVQVAAVHLGELADGPNEPLTGEIPIAHWRLDDGSGTSAADSSGNGYTGTLTGTQGWTTGQIAGGFSFNYAGGDDYFTFPANPTLNDVNEGDYTLSAWVKPLSIPPGSGAANDAAYGILMKQGNHIGLVFSASGRFSANHYLTGGVYEGVSSTNTYAANVWYHVTQVVSKSLGHTLLYVDGVLQGTNTFTAGTASQDYGTGPWRLGIASPGAGGYRWHSHLTVDDVRVYSQALSAAEVMELYD